MRWLTATIALGCVFDSSGTGGATSPVDGSIGAADASTASPDAAPRDATSGDAQASDAAPLDAGCPAICIPGSDPCCPQSCMPQQTCGCFSGETCYFRCTGADCAVGCSGNASCSVDCGSATARCGLTCAGSQASCTILCVGAANCSLQCNPTATTTCAGGVQVCGRSCP